MFGLSPVWYLGLCSWRLVSVVRPTAMIARYVSCYHLKMSCPMELGLAPRVTRLTRAESYLCG